ncbi:MAG: hypothetical protein VXY92_03050, partial [Planctomycetota bacterium]|nr:hypothetical protein [Planctomycetota bacterium]
GYGGVFFWFYILRPAEANAELADVARRRELAAALRRRVLALPEVDGCFVDSHELGRCYGTAMALLCLDTLARAAR